jgi:hypothetical protein
MTLKNAPVPFYMQAPLLTSAAVGTATMLAGLFGITGTSSSGADDGDGEVCMHTTIIHCANAYDNTMSLCVHYITMLHRVTPCTTLFLCNFVLSSNAVYCHSCDDAMLHLPVLLSSCTHQCLSQRLATIAPCNMTDHLRSVLYCCSRSACYVCQSLIQ